MADVPQGAFTKGAQRILGSGSGRGKIDSRGGGLSAPSNDSRLQRMVISLESDIIPRLVMARGTPCRFDGSSAPSDVSPDDVAEFVDLLLTHDETAAQAYIEAMQARGYAIEALYLDLLAPSAHLLGRMWEEDLCHFTDVTLAMGQMQRLVRELAPVFQGEKRGRRQGRRMLLTPTVGEQHTFGLYMLAEFVRRTGWEVWSRTPKSRSELIALVRKQWFAVVGISVGSESQFKGVAADIKALRQASANRRLAVMVGGHIFIDQPNLVAQIGADATAVDGPEAARKAETLFARPVK